MGEEIKAELSVSFLLTHGRSNRLFLTRHGVKQGNSETWGLIAGRVDKGENLYEAVLREAKEEANIERENIIFVRGRNNLEPHPVVILGEEYNWGGYVFDATYSGPKLPMDGWDISGDRSVDRVELFDWRRVLGLLNKPEKIYRPEFNFAQMMRWIMMDYGGGNENRKVYTNRWLLDRQGKIEGLVCHGRLFFDKLSDNWDYIPPYNRWMEMPGIRGNPRKTNFARERYQR
jgi:8-oxo-dGTP pyrophosphatase MutT (NUDIX family)